MSLGEPLAIPKDNRERRRQEISWMQGIQKAMSDKNLAPGK